jgi:hypothetical protein
MLVCLQKSLLGGSQILYITNPRTVHFIDISQWFPLNESFWSIPGNFVFCLLNFFRPQPLFLNYI